MGQGPWAKPHGPGPMGQAPWAKAIWAWAISIKLILSGVVGVNPNQARKGSNQQNKLFLFQSGGIDPPSLPPLPPPQAWLRLF